jgi:serine protease Do
MGFPHSWSCAKPEGATMINFHQRLGLVGLLLALPWSAGVGAGAPRSPGAAESALALRAFNAALQALAARVSPSVVQIQTSGFAPVSEGTGASAGIVARQHSIGSGVILDPEGYILTNAHVVQGAQRIKVELTLPAAQTPAPPVPFKQVYDAKLVGLDRDTDVALLKIEAHGLPALPLGADLPVQPGELVLAIGSPEGLRNSITFGVISSVGREANPNQPMEYLQTDAPINHGSSGGPLVNMDGQVLGLNTFILSEGGGSEGLGFAIPAKALKFVYDRLRRDGQVRRIELQAAAQNVTPDLAAALGLTQDWGVIIADVMPGGPAEAGGLQAQDVVLTIDGHPIMSMLNFSTALNLHPLETPVSMGVLRGGKKVALTLAALPRGQGFEHMDDLVDPDNRIGRLGIFAATFNHDRAGLLPSARIPSGVLVVALSQDPNAVTGELRPGDLLHALNQAPLVVVEDLKAQLHKLQPGMPGVLTVERQGRMVLLVFEMN